MMAILCPNFLLPKHSQRAFISKSLNRIPFDDLLIWVLIREDDDWHVSPMSKKGTAAAVVADRVPFGPHSDGCTCSTTITRGGKQVKPSFGNNSKSAHSKSLVAEAHLAM